MDIEGDSRREEIGMTNVSRRRLRSTGAVLGGLALLVAATPAIAAPAVAAADTTRSPGVAASTVPLIDADPAAVLATTAVGGTAALPDSLTQRAVRVSGDDPTRVSGSDRYATAVELSNKYFPRGTETVVVATGTGFADALAAAPLAASLDAPVLLTRPAGAPETVRTEVARLRPQRLIAVGGTAAVSRADLVDLAAAAGGASTDRVAGADRYATAAAVAGRLAPLDFAVVASGVTFADALSAGPLAASRAGAVLLTPPDRLGAAAATAVTGLPADAVLIAGGTGAVSATVASDLQSLLGAAPGRLGGVDRYDTSALFAAEVAGGDGQPGALLTTGADYPDAMVSAAHGSRLGQPVLLMGGPYRFGHDAALARERGVGAWLQLTLDALAATDRGRPLMHTAYTHAYRADTVGRAYGWDHDEAVASLELMRGSVKPDGGYGLDRGWDAFGDGTTNPAATSYLVTITDHVGRALLDGFEAGAVPAEEIAALVEIVRNWPTVEGQPGCLAYSNSEFDRTSCVHNVNTSAIWFIDAAERAGSWPGPPADLSQLLEHETDAYLGDGWWPYRDDQESRQDVNHNAAQVEQLRFAAAELGAEALALMVADPAVPYHPDEAMRSAYDPIGFLRLGEQDCDAANAAYGDSATLTQTVPYAITRAQIALWSARVASQCAAPPTVAAPQSLTLPEASPANRQLPLLPLAGPQAAPVPST
jgi:putative cell wall-binding protein